MTNVKKERLLELLADQTVFGLSEEELMELKQLKTQFPEWEKDVSFELTAASINLANLDISKEMPANLRAKISASADEFFNQTDTAPTAIRSMPNVVETVGRSVEVEPKRPFWQWLGWAVAAAACIALAINLWQSRSRPQPEIVNRTPETVQTPKPQLSAVQEREQLLATAKDVVQTTWTSPTDKTKVLGDIVWSNERQQGYMRFRGLPPNDPNREAYQLWIADETQNPKTPISGGVFDISSTGDGEVVVPIDAQIMVKKPKAFNITKEKPGGVVVSDLSSVVAVAAI